MSNVTENKFVYNLYELKDDKLLYLSNTYSIVEAANRLRNYFKNPTEQGLIRAIDLKTNLSTIIHTSPPPFRFAKISTKVFWFFGEERNIGDWIEIPISMTSPNKECLEKGKYQLVHRTANRAIFLKEHLGYLRDLNINPKYYDNAAYKFSTIYTRTTFEVTRKEFPILFMNPEKNKKRVMN